MASAPRNLQQDAAAGCGDLWLHPRTAVGWGGFRHAAAASRRWNGITRVRMVRANGNCAGARAWLFALACRVARYFQDRACVPLHFFVHRGAGGAFLPRMDAE